MVEAYSMYTTKVFGIKDKTTSQKALSCSTISTFETHLESHSRRKKINPQHQGKYLIDIFNKLSQFIQVSTSPVSANRTEPGSYKD